jgi:hypothetical protein
VAILTVGTTGRVLVPRDRRRTSIHVENRSSTANIYLDTMPAGGITTTNASIRLAPNESADITELEDGIVVKDEWAVVSDAANTQVTVFVGYKE